MSFRQRRKRIIWSCRGRCSARSAPCFFTSEQCLHPPPAAAFLLAQLRHTRLYLFFSQFPAYWLSAIRPRRFPQKHSRGSSLGSLAPLLVSSPRSNASIRPRRRHSSSPNCATPGYIYILVCFPFISFLILIRGAFLRNIVA